MKKYTIATALALLLLWTPDVQAQDASMANWDGTWTTIGQLPAGQRHAPKDAQMIGFAVRLSTNNAQGSIVVDGPEGTKQYKLENIKVYNADGVGLSDYFTFSWEPREDYWVSCTLANRGETGPDSDRPGRPARFSGLCWDEAQNEGWMQMYRGFSGPPTPQEGRPEEG